jgi:CopG family transcriptional regulator, nickel-responsive regulator
MLANPSEVTMQRITITIEDDLLALVDAQTDTGGYPNRSEAIRDLLRTGIRQTSLSQPGTACIGVLTYVFDHNTRALAQRLVNTFHAHHDMTVVTTHVHLDHETCLEVAVVKGEAVALQKLKEAITAQRGVRHGTLHLIPSQETEATHDHGSGQTRHPHIHV